MGDANGWLGRWTAMPAARAVARFLAVLKIAALIGVAAAAQPPHNPFGQFRHIRWTADDGAPTNIREIAQTPDGYLWLASGDGLYRFDGASFERISAPAGSAMEFASPAAFAVSRAGELWVGYSEGGGVAVYRNGALVDTHLPNPPTPITEMMQSPDGAIWAATSGWSNRAWRFAAGRWESLENRLPTGALMGLVPALDGTLYLPLSMMDAQRTSLLTYLPPGTRSLRRSPLRLGVFPRLAFDGDANLWVSDTIGTRMLLDRTGRPPAGAALFPPVPGLRSATMAFDRAGGLWGTTGTVGIFYIPAAARTRRAAGAAVHRFGTADGLTSDIANFAFLDREGSIWIGGGAGLDQFRPASVIGEPAIPLDPIEGHSVARATNGDVYFASLGNIFLARPGQSPRPVFRFGSGFSAICAAGDRIWATGSRRILRITPEGNRSIAPPGRSDVGYYCAQDRRGRLWVTLADGSWAWHDGAGWHVPAPAAGGPSVTGLVPTASGDIAMATDGGDILILSAENLSVTRTARPRIRSISLIQAGRRDLYVSSSDAFLRLRGNGWQRLDGRRFPWLTRLKGLVQTDRGETWLLGRDGISRLATADLERAFDDPAAPLSRRLFNAQDGVTGTVQHFDYFGVQAVAGGDGRIWVANRDGVAFVDPDRLPHNRLPPPVLIRSLTAGDRVYRDPAGLALAAGTRTLEIAFTAPSLVVPRRVRFRYRLQGVDENWVEAGNRRLASYANLGPGRYRFQVVAANDDGVWNETGATLEFEIPPTFVQGWPFRLLCVLLLVAALWLAFALRLRAMARRIRSRMAERLAERERIARELHDTLLQSVQSLTMRFQLAVDDLPAQAPARPALEQAIDRADAVIAEGRDRVRDLRLPREAGDLRAIIETILDQQDFCPDVARTVTVSGAVRTLDPLALDEITRIAAEALFNVRRHAAAARVDVEIGYHANFTLQVTDDGRGIDPRIVERGGKDGHFGLSGMRERAERLRGRLTLRRIPEGGTQVALSVPGSVAYQQARGRFLSRLGISW